MLDWMDKEKASYQEVLIELRTALVDLIDKRRKFNNAMKNHAVIQDRGITMIALHGGESPDYWTRRVETSKNDEAHKVMQDWMIAAFEVNDAETEMVIAKAYFDACVASLKN